MPNRRGVALLVMSIAILAVQVAVAGRASNDASQRLEIISRMLHNIEQIRENQSTREQLLKEIAGVLHQMHATAAERLTDVVPAPLDEQLHTTEANTPLEVPILLPSEEK
jgi:hypothetical protein